MFDFYQADRLKFAESLVFWPTMPVLLALLGR
jgi:hypothetical protein